MGALFGPLGRPNRSPSASTSLSPRPLRRTSTVSSLPSVGASLEAWEEAWTDRKAGMIPSVRQGR